MFSRPSMATLMILTSFTSSRSHSGLMHPTYTKYLYAEVHRSTECYFSFSEGVHPYFDESAHVSEKRAWSVPAKSH